MHDASCGHGIGIGKRRVRCTAACMRLTLIPPIHSRLLPAPLSPLRPLVLSCGSWFPSTAQQPQLVVGRTLVPCAASRQPCCPDVSACLGRIGCVCHRSAAQHRTKARSVVPPLLLRQLYGPRNSCSHAGLHAGDRTDRNAPAKTTSLCSMMQTTAWTHGSARDCHCQAVGATS